MSRARSPECHQFKAYPDNLVTALTALLDEPPESALDWIHWLA